jgi:hypothetical protein
VSIKYTKWLWNRKIVYKIFQHLPLQGLLKICKIYIFGTKKHLATPLTAWLHACSSLTADCILFSLLIIPYHVQKCFLIFICFCFVNMGGGGCRRARPLFFF